VRSYLLRIVRYENWATYGATVIEHLPKVNSYVGTNVIVMILDPIVLRYYKNFIELKTTACDGLYRFHCFLNTEELNSVIFYEYTR
jgi:hypothetical protein